MNGGKLVVEGRIAVEPGGPLLVGRAGRIERVAAGVEHKPGTHHVVVEAEHPHPGFIEDMVQGGVVTGKRMIGNAAPASRHQVVSAFDAGEVRIERA